MTSLPADSVEEMRDVEFQEIRGRIEGFLSATFGPRWSDGLTPDTDLFEGGHLDSLGFIELLVFLEQEYGIEIPEDDLLSPDISRVDGIARIVQHLVHA